MSESDPQVWWPFSDTTTSLAGAIAPCRNPLVARTYAAQIQPDIIILGFFAANDVIPNALTRIDDEEIAQVAERIERFRNDLRAELGPCRHSMIFRILSLTNPFSSRLVYQLERQPWVLGQNYELLRQFQGFCSDHKYRFGVVFQHTTDSLASGWRAAFYPRDDVHHPLARSANAPESRSWTCAASSSRPVIGSDSSSRGDAHCSAQGVRKTAEAIYQQLIRPQLVGHSAMTDTRRRRGRGLPLPGRGRYPIVKNS